MSLTLSPVTAAISSSYSYAMLSCHNGKKNVEWGFVARVKGTIFRRKKEEVGGRWKQLYSVVLGNLQQNYMEYRQ